MVVDLGQGAGLCVEPQVRFALVFVGTVAGEAILGQDWPNVAIEFDPQLIRPDYSRRAARKRQNQGDTGATMHH